MIKLKKWMMNPCEECMHVLLDETGEAVIVDCGAYYPNERVFCWSISRNDIVPLMWTNITPS